MKVSLFCLFLWIQTRSLCVSQWTHSISLDQNKYMVEWRFDDHKQQITFHVVVQTRGWIGFGISPNGHMTGSDIVIGWLDHNGKTHFTDRFAEDEELPTIDASQDWHLLNSYANATHTSITFMRAYYTCDKEYDIQITSDIMKIVWAYNDDSPSSAHSILQHKHHQRGGRSVRLLSVASKNRLNDEHKDGHVKKWDITSSDMLIPNSSDTTYWCKIVIAPFRTKRHVIRIEPIISPASNAPFVHHMVLYRCLHPNSSHMLQYVQHKGANCFDFANMPFDFIHCQSVYMVWATGGDAFDLPNDVGMPLSEDDETTYFLFEIHYDNPERVGDRYDSSGLRLFYTSKLRKYDADTATVGSVVDYRLLIPPKQESVTVSGHCHPTCFKSKMSANGITVIASLPHGHKHMRKILVRHFRNHTELAPIARENNYDFNFQDLQRIDGGRVVLPSDQITVECTYNTMSRDTPLFGGLSTKEEMCIAFLIYYPRMKSTRTCLSGLTPQIVAQVSDIDIEDSIDNDLNPFIKSQNLSKERLSTYVTNKNYWEPQRMRESLQLIRFAPQKAQCYWRKIDGVEGMDDIEELIEYPKLNNEYSHPTYECQSVVMNCAYAQLCAPLIHISVLLLLSTHFI